MTERKQAQTSGFRLRRVYAMEQVYELLDVDAIEEGGPEERDIGFGWDWRVVGERAFEVLIALTVRGNKSAPEEVRLVLIGAFEVSGNTTTVTISDFVQKMAPAILFPYAREIVSSLTGRGPYGTFHLPAMNVLKLMEDKDYSKSTGARQLKEAGGEDLLLGSGVAEAETAES